MLLPKHNTWVTAVEVVVPVPGCVMLTVLVVVLLLLASVTVTVLAPAFSELITDVVAAVDHK